MAKIKFRVDLFAPEKFPSEILVGQIREYNEDKITVNFPTSKECIIEGNTIKIRKSDIEKTLNLKLPAWNISCITNTTIWQRTVLEIDGVLETTENELIIKSKVKNPENLSSRSNRRQLPRAPVCLNLPANVKTKKGHVLYGQISDISKEGLGINSQILPELDEMIEVTFEFSDINLKFENVQAQVEWQRNDLQRFGARWIGMKEDEEKILNWFTSE